jgi:hypothetical protein
MSKDLKIEKICDHQIILEQVEIEADLKTIKIPRPISSKSVDLWINGFKIESSNIKFGWNIEEDTSSIYTKRNKIVLHKKRKSVDDFFQLTYYVKKEMCPKCLGLGVINDISYSKLGKVLTVENEEKLLQEVKKGLITYLGSNPFHTWIGTEIYQLIGSKAYNLEVIKARIIQEISQYLEKYLDIQIQQSQYQDVTLREAFHSLLAVDVVVDPNIDITYWTVAVIFRNRTGDELLFEKTMPVPSN